MKVLITNYGPQGPVKAVVHCKVDEHLPIAFPETSYPKLCDLLALLGAESNTRDKYQSHWQFDIDPVRLNCLEQERDAAKSALTRETHLVSKLENMVESLQIRIKLDDEHLDGLTRLSFWERIWLVFDPSRLKLPT